MAGNDPQSKASVSAFITSLGHRPQDVGNLSMAHWLEGASLIEMGLAQNGLGWNLFLGVDTAGKA
ncbi:hypothetical protein [Glaciihabitans sp. UYNi722]|uniref:hypothetical protein n=1 Tax=Glaciihabitans sp. UYNi722 TaxID=3156344 RepID=UPI003392A807